MFCLEPYCLVVRSLNSMIISEKYLTGLLKDGVGYKPLIVVAYSVRSFTVYIPRIVIRGVIHFCMIRSEKGQRVEVICFLFATTMYRIFRNLRLLRLLLRVFLLTVILFVKRRLLREVLSIVIVCSAFPRATSIVS